MRDLRNGEEANSCSARKRVPAKQRVIAIGQNCNSLMKAASAVRFYPFGALADVHTKHTEQRPQPIGLLNLMLHKSYTRQARFVH